MNYRKIPTPENFRFAPAALGRPGAGEPPAEGGRGKRVGAPAAEGLAVAGSAVRLEGGPFPPVELSLRREGPGLFRLRGESARWSGGSGSLAGLDGGRSAAVGGPEAVACELKPDGGVDLSLGGTPLLSGAGFGLAGASWLLRFEPPADTRYYGLGGKNLGFELSGKRALFWNTDLFAEFDWAEIAESRADPLYASFPVLIGRKAADATADPGSAAPLWWAVVMDAPWPGFVNLGAGEGIFAAGSTPWKPWLYLGARGGAPDLWLLADDDPARLVRRLQLLQGTMPLPPLWALGHHQCRWGYRSYADLQRVADEYEARGIPNDGLWLDIDYMDGFRVFTVDAEHFDEPAARLAELRERGYAVVPILDPGLRRDEAYAPYARAKAGGLLCTTEEGLTYTGFVWPGYTAFPDFSLPEGRAFWADEVERLTRLGFSGYWIDMNDPSTGSAPPEDMRFGRGSRPHEAFRNQYALGMAMATRDGLARVRPDERPFVISRSAYLGMAKHAGMWTGDNVSNPTHLKAAPAFSLNLSVSGMPMNGPDVPGFAGDADGALMEAWYKAGFLFPFLRNHNVAGARDQEPWTRGKATERVAAAYIRSRYALLPYLYQAWIAQEEDGEPVMRPLWYAWPEEEWTADCGDEFLIGPDILHAPILEPKAGSRSVRLPAGSWFDWNAGGYRRGGQAFTAEAGRADTPLYFRAGAAVAFQRGPRRDHGKELRAPDLMIFAGGGAEDGGSGSLRYAADDGLSLSYRDGARTELELAWSYEGGVLSIEAEYLRRGYGPIRPRVLIPAASAPGAPAVLRFRGRESALKPGRLEFAGRRAPVLASRPLDLD